MSLHVRTVLGDSRPPRAGLYSGRYTDRYSGRYPGRVAGWRAAPAALALSVAMGLLVPAAACGGDDKQAEEPTLDNSSTEPEPDPEPVVVSAEQFDEVKRFFDRKSRFLNTCFTSAIEAGEISKRGSAQLSVQVTVTEAGQVENPRATIQEPKSDTLRDCIFEKMSRWQLTTLPTSMEYSHTFRFTTL